MPTVHLSADPGQGGPLAYTNTIEWSSGIYVVVMINDDGRTLSSKWVKE